MRSTTMRATDDRNVFADGLAGQEAVAFPEFREAVSRAVVALDVQSRMSDTFRGALTASLTGDIHLLDVTADQHSVHRTEGLIARSPKHYLKFNVIESGSGLVLQDGREARVTAGDLVVYDTERPYSLIFDDQVRLSVVMFPRDLLEIPQSVLAQVTAVRLGGPTGAGALVGNYIVGLARELDRLEQHASRRLVRAALDMVGTVIETAVGAQASTHGHGAIVRRILDHIDENLASSDLTPASIAAAHFISLRHLHGLFAEQGTTVSTLIRTRRLERAYDALVDPRHVGRLVSSIAFETGFADPAHFSRTFRAHFGVAPSEVRQPV